MDKDLAQALAQGELDAALEGLYGPDRLAAARERVKGVLAGFSAAFGAKAQQLFSAPGRTELGGNHTDHQHGHVLAAAVDLDLLCATRPNGSGVVRLQSEGYEPIQVDLGCLTPQPQEVNTSAALIRGVAARMMELGCPMRGIGLDVYLTSRVPGGSGLSSSAAFEVLFGAIFNCLFWEGRATPVELAQIGQYAENVFFGKPCGLMDQTACAVGGAVAIDFADPAHPAVERIDLDLAGYGYALCILDSGADHADLTDEYAAITDELRAVSALMGKSVLREVPEGDFLARLPALRSAASDRAVLRALHFYGEDRRAVLEAQALARHDFPGFLALVRESGQSSAECLQNVTPTGAVQRQDLMLTVALARHLLGDRGAARVHGGGFGGTAQALVPLDLLPQFQTAMERVLGPGSCHVLSVRPVGGVQLA